MFSPVIISLLALNRNLFAAEKVAKFSLMFYQKLNPTSLDTIFHLGLYSEVLRNQCRFAEAEATVRQAILLIDEKSDSQKNKRETLERQEKSGALYELLGSILRDQGRYSEALKAGKKACEIFEELQKSQPQSDTPAPELSQINRALANSYYELSRTLDYTGQPADAITLLHQGLTLVEGTGENISENTSVSRFKASMLAELSRAYLMSGDFTEAECAAQLAQSNLSASKHPEDQLARARVLLAVADLLAQSPEKTAEDRKKTSSLRDEAIQIRKQWLLPKDPELMDVAV